MKRIIFTGGGTGGHVYPGLAVYDALPEYLQQSVVWVGSRGGVEEGIVTGAGITYRSIPSGKLRRYFDLKNVTDFFRVIAGFFVALRLLRVLQGGVVFSKGGFVAVPVVCAAWLRGIPVVIHESDGDPGLATRLTAPLARLICLPYEDTRNAFPARLSGRIVITGNPVREQFFSAGIEEALASIGLSETKDPVLLITGGSLGARQLNRWIEASISELTARAVVVHQTGYTDEERIVSIRERAVPGRYHGAPTFTDNFPALLRRADVVVARAGAGTIWEIAAAGRPAVLVPLSLRASRGDQIRNAERYRKSGAAQVIDDPDATADDFMGVVLPLLEHPANRDRMAKAARRWSRADAAVLIADHIATFLSV